MSFKFRKVLPKLILMISVLILVGCGQAAAPEPQKPEVAEVVVEPTAAEVVEARSIKFAFDNPPFWNEQAQRFAGQAGVEVNYEEVPFPQLHDFYQTNLLGGESGIDVLHVHDGWAAEWGSRELLLPLDDLVTDEYKNDLPPGTLDLLSVDGKLYGFPLYYWTTNFYYRTDLFDASGVEVPENLVEMLAVSQKLKEDHDVHGVLMALGTPGQASTTFAIAYRGEGGEVLTDGQPSFNTEAAVAALTNLVALNDAGVIDPSSFELTGSVPASNQYVQGGVAMLWGPPPTFNFAANPEISKVEGNVAVALVPGGSVNRSASAHETGSRAIAFNSGDVDAAKDFLLYVTQSDEMVDMALTLGRVPARISALSNEKVQAEYPLAGIMAEQLSYPGGLPIVHENGTEIADAVGRQVLEAIQAGKDPAQALADAEAEVLQIIK